MICIGGMKTSGVVKIVRNAFCVWRMWGVSDYMEKSDLGCEGLSRSP
jgi:hypothetical protein